MPFCCVPSCDISFSAVGCVWDLHRNFAWCREEIFSPLGFTLGESVAILLQLTLRGQRNSFSFSYQELEHDIMIWICHVVTKSLGKRRPSDPTSGMILLNDLTPFSLFPQLSRTMMAFYSTTPPSLTPLPLLLVMLLWMMELQCPEIREAAWEAQRAVCWGRNPANFHYLKCVTCYKLCFNINIFLCKTYFIA